MKSAKIIDFDIEPRKHSSRPKAPVTSQGAIHICKFDDRFRGK